MGEVGEEPILENMDGLYEYMVLELAYGALSSDNWNTRVLATEILERAGERARPWIDHGCASNDLEVRGRCEQLRAKLPSTHLSNAEEIARIGRRMLVLTFEPEGPGTREELEALAKRAAEILKIEPGVLKGWRDHTLAAMRMLENVAWDKNVPEELRARARELHEGLVIERHARNAEPPPVIREDAENAEVQPSEDEDPNAVREREAEELGRRDERDDD